MPATKLFIPLIVAAFSEIATSKAIGPAISAPGKTPFLASLTISTASLLEGISDVGTSVPEISATRGFVLPSACISSIAFRVISIFCFTRGKIFITASVIHTPDLSPGTVI